MLEVKNRTYYAVQYRRYSNDWRGLGALQSTIENALKQAEKRRKRYSNWYNSKNYRLIEITTETHFDDEGDIILFIRTERVLSKDIDQYVP